MKTETSKRLPPGNLGLPIIGESLAIAANNHQFYKDRFAKYGPIFKTRLFGINFIVFSGPEGMHRFGTDPAIERGGVDPLSVKQIFVNSLALIDGPEHRVRKGSMLRAVQHRDAIERYLPRMQRILESYIARWETRGSLTLQPEVRRIAAAFTAALYTGLVDDEQHIADIDKKLGWMRDAFMTLPLAIPGTKYARAIAGRKFLQRIIAEAVERHRGGGYDDIVSSMMATHAESGITEDRLRGDLLHLIFAGQGGFFVPFLHITTTLGQHPDFMEKARQEVLAVAPEGPVTMDQIDQLQYIERLSKELRRYFAMNSATFFGKVLKDIEVGGYHIPAGWGAIGGIHITMRNPQVYEDPGRFDPDRFLPERLGPEGSYVPHGHGARTSHKCPGEDIVTVSVKLYLTLLLRRLRWDLPAQDLTMTNELFPVPKSGVQVNFHPVDAKGGELPKPAAGVAHR